MLSSKVTFILFASFIILCSILSETQVEGRYLQTRSSGDRAEKLRELLKELIENELEKEESQNGDSVPRWHPESKLFYKREVKPTH